MKVQYFAGIDIGSTTTKVVVINDKKEVIGTDLCATSPIMEKAAKKSMQTALDAAGLKAEDVSYIVATGYGRRSISFCSVDVTEITCHVRGARSLVPEVRLVIDIGGQDSKVIAINEQGWVDNFVMNDKCSAGTGRFLEVMSRVLETDLASMGKVALTSQSPAAVSSTCTVFAESEIISLMAAGQQVKDLIAGIHFSIARRIAGMTGQVKMREPAMMTGGVAKNIGVVHALEVTLGIKLTVPPNPQMVGALGAALIAYEQAQAESKSPEMERTK